MGEAWDVFIETAAVKKEAALHGLHMHSSGLRVELLQKKQEKHLEKTGRGSERVNQMGLSTYALARRTGATSLFYEIKPPQKKRGNAL